MLLDKGRRALGLSPTERRVLGEKLIRGSDVDEYVNAGICYEVVVFVAYLLGHAQLRDAVERRPSYTSQEYMNAFQFERCGWWIGQPIPFGTIVGFRRISPAPATVFHAALATGRNAELRSSNNPRLGAHWTSSVMLTDVLQQDPDRDGAYPYYNAERIHVHLLRLPTP